MNESEEKVPGLHRVGPNPWDFEFNPVKGQQISFEVKGVIYTETIIDVEEDELLGTTTITLGKEVPDGYTYF